MSSPIQERGKSIPASSGGFTLGTEQPATSTEVIFSIPNGVKFVSVFLSNVSQTSTSSNPFLFQLGTAGGISTSGYSDGHSAFVSGGAAVIANASTGFALLNNNAANNHNGSLELYLGNSTSSTWYSKGSIHSGASAIAGFQDGHVSLNAPLTTIRITTQNRTATFDNGVMNITYE